MIIFLKHHKDVTSEVIKLIGKGQRLVKSKSFEPSSENYHTGAFAKCLSQ